MDECCATCNYCCEVKAWPTFENVLTHVCVFHLVEWKVGYITESSPYDRCECWKKREEIDK